MTTLTLHPRRRQRGSATLVVSLLLLFSITLITLYTTRSAIMEQNISANQVRADQALTAAEAGLDAAIAWYNSADFDLATAPTSPEANRWDRTDFPFTNNIGYNFQVFYCNPDAFSVTTADALLGCAAPTDEEDVGMVAIGFSDDGSARRVVGQRVGAVSLLRDGGSGASISTRAGAALGGNMRAVNRYTNTTIWTGGDVTGNMGSVETFVLDPKYNKGDLTRAQLTMEVGSNGAGAGEYAAEASQKDGSTTRIKADIIENDPNLVKISRDDFFELFFNTTRAAVYAAAQKFTSIPGNLSSLSGYVWIGPDADTTGTDSFSLPAAGTLAAPIFLIVNGSCDIGSNSDFVGLIYCTGEIGGNGNPVLKGAMASETGVDFDGIPEIIYDPEALSGGTPPGGGGGVAGTWRDFRS